VGREHDVATVGDLLRGADARLLTLIGTGGVGKTRLAARVSEESREALPDGVRWVSLETLTDPAILPHFVTARLGIVVRGGMSVEDALVGVLRRQQLILVFDNCEHLLPTVARLAGTLLSSCPHLRILATSREPLALPGEVTWRVMPLLVPTHDVAGSVDDVRLYDAVNLFVARGAAILPGFRLTSGNSASVVRICQRLEGVPLALELAAAWLRMLSPEELAARLDNSLQLLARGGAAAPTRHQSLRATLDWSYRLLEDAERVMFARLAVFPGSFSLAAAENTCAGPDGNDVISIMARLVDASLVLVHDRGEETRYRMLEPLRQYAREQLAGMASEQWVYERHRDWVVGLAATASGALSGPEQGRWLDRLESEHDDISAALRWSLAHGDAGGAGQIATAVWSFWLMRGHMSEGRRWVESILAAMVDRTPMRGHLLWIKGILSRSDHVEAEQCFTESIDLYRAMGNRDGEARVLGSLGFMSQALGDHDRAIACIEASLALLDETPDSIMRARVLTGLALSVLASGDTPRAAELCGEARAISQRLGDDRTDAAAMANLGLVCRINGDVDMAEALWEESLAVRRRLGDLGGVAHVLALLGTHAARHGNHARAASLLSESRDLRRRIGEEHGLALVYEGMAALGAAQGHLRPAVQLAGAAEALRDALAEPRLPWDREEHAWVLGDLRARLDPGPFADAWREGASMVRDEPSIANAVREALVIVDEPVPPLASFSQGGDGLTPREIEVLRHLTYGLTYAQIGEALMISPRTVDAHVRSIFGKLDVHSRSAATRVALQEHLI
jgi:non-specific serine/threonine protein kinase